MARRSREVYQFKVTLRGIRPPVWRRIQVPENYSFWDLHVAIQDALGWLDCHLHAFYIANPVTGQREEIGIPDEEWAGDKILPGWKKKIAHYFTPENKKARYVYDFGDDWEHDVVLEKILPRNENIFYPCCIAGRRSAPPEDCGGLWGYENLLQGLENPDHEEHEEIIEWVGKDFDPDDFNKEAIVFSDPQTRLESAFSGNAREEEHSGEEKETEDGEFFLEPWVELWDKVRRRDVSDLSPGEEKIARIMQDHESIFSETLDKVKQGGADEEEDIGLLFHVLIHMTVEDQLERGKPLEIRSFYEAMKEQGCSHHDTVHLAGSLWASLFLESTYEKKRFPSQKYRNRLKKFKDMKPREIWDLLKKEQFQEIK